MIKKIRLGDVLTAKMKARNQMLEIVIILGFFLIKINVGYLKYIVNNVNNVKFKLIKSFL